MKKYFVYGIFISCMLYILYPYIIFYVCYAYGNPVFPKFFKLVMIIYMTIEITTFINLGFSIILSKISDISLKNKIIEYSKGFIFGVIGTLCVLLMVSAIKFIIKYNFYDDENIIINNPMIYIKRYPYVPSLIPFTTVKWLIRDIKVGVIFYIYSTINVVSAHLLVSSKVRIILKILICLFIVCCFLYGMYYTYNMSYNIPH